ncbi:lipoprotein [Vibrio comitans NBRC 102076]|uniref:Lipoprotein n=1 Tax=Vibrio comitans NBRC 102076 TaxID=1219078 RepID=A0A4Y3IQW5_9VIBR|nr:lipoprotein [Vibrio comitans NBRC 102076]
MNKKLLLLTIPLVAPTIVIANDEVADMSDPLAVFTQVGAGMTDRGLNLKIGQMYDTGSDITAAMNVIEIKGIGGETLGGRSDANDSVDSFRFRNFGVELTNGRGKQIDMNYDFQNESGTVSYSIIQALPSFGPLTLYPLAGAGVAFGNAVEDDGSKEAGYLIPGTFGVIGTYARINVTDKLWLNYNPMWMTTLSGSDDFTDNGFAGRSDLLTHEFAVSYQIQPRFNVRYYANWDQVRSFDDGDHRIEFNYQL